MIQVQPPHGYGYYELAYAYDGAGRPRSDATGTTYTKTSDEGHRGHLRPQRGGSGRKIRKQRHREQTIQHGIGEEWRRADEDAMLYN